MLVGGEKGNWIAPLKGPIKTLVLAPFVEQEMVSMLAQLRRRPRPLKGRGGACAFQSVCGGNTRIRALQLTGDPWAEDPACYLSNAEIGLKDAERLTVTPFRGKRHDPAHDFSL